MLKPGDTISRYRIIGPIGKGGMGEVYQAEDTRLLRPVALKFLPPDSLNPDDRQRLIHEARAAAVIRHPNICPIYDVEEASGQLFIAMAYLEGDTLRRAITRGSLGIPESIDIAAQILSGLAQAHSLGIIHRDIKSGNIILSPHGHAYILDFGLALREGLERLTEDGRTVGTPAYMAPEQLRGLAVGPAADIWAVGLLLFEMLTGQHPFRRDQNLAIIQAILNDAPLSLSTLRPEAPPELDAILKKALSKDPAQRFTSAREFADQLRLLQPSRTLSTPQTSTPDEPTRSLVSVTPTVTPKTAPPPQKTSRTPLILAAALTTALALAAAGFYYFREPSPTTTPIAASRQVAVLPFSLTSASDNARVLADGLHEVLTASLSEFQSAGGRFLVIPAAEVRRRNLASPDDAKRFYGANLVLTGALQPLGQKFQLTLAAIDTATMRQLGATTIDYDPADPLPSRDRTIAQAARILQVDWRAPNPTASTGESSTPAAYSAYLEGRGLMARYDLRGNIEKAIERFTQATTLDPKSALAWSGLAEAYWRQSRSLASKELAARALDAAERAAKLEPNLAIVHTTLGAIYGTAGREADAIRELERAMQLSPLNAQPPRELARIYSGSGRVAEAEKLYLQSINARPTDWYGHFLLGVLYYQREQYDKSETVLRKSLELAPGNDLVSRQLGGVYLQQGRYKEAIDELSASLKIKPNPVTYMTLASGYFYQHRYREAVTAMETAIDLDTNRYYYWGNLGTYYKWTPGEQAKSLVALRKAVDLAQKQLEVTPKDYDIHADLAEYKARLGDRRGALAQIALIPEAEQQPRASRLALAYELTGNRPKAIDLIKSRLTNPASLTQIKDDPDLAGLWSDPQFQAAIPKK